MHVAQKQRFWDNDMHKNKDLKRVARIRFSATRLSCRHCLCLAKLFRALFEQVLFPDWWLSR